MSRSLPVDSTVVGQLRMGGMPVRHSRMLDLSAALPARGDANYSDRKFCVWRPFDKHDEGGCYWQREEMIAVSAPSET